MPRGVTPAGIRAGAPDALAGLLELRGSAVRAYAGAVVEPEVVVAAAAEAMAGFRASVVRATDTRGLDPDSILLRAVREASALRARRPAGAGPAGRRLTRPGDSACELVPGLLAARASRELSHDDAVRLDRHLAGCPDCRALRERFRAAENLYAEAPGTPLDRGDARALLLALARAAPLAAGTPRSVAEDALALLTPDTVGRPHRAPVVAPPPAPAPRTRPADPWPRHPGVDDAGRDQRPAPPAGAAASPDAPSARHGGGVGTAPGRGSFGRRTVVIRSGLEPSGPPAPGSEPKRAGAQRPAPPAEPEHASNGGRLEAPVPVLPPAAHAYAPAPTIGGAPGAPPDSGTLARVIPGVLIVVAIAIALVVAGIVGPGNTPATSDDIEPSSVREPVRDRDATGALRTPLAPAATGPHRPRTDVAGREPVRSRS